MGRIISLFFILLIIGAGIAGGLFAYDMHLRVEQQALLLPEGGDTFNVQAGETVGTVARRLYKDGWSKIPPWALHIDLKLRQQSTRIKLGQYQLKPGITLLELVQQLVEGDVIQYRITFVEGWNFKQMRAVMEKNPQLSQTLAGKSDAELMTLIGHAGEHPEGRFFPDTYQFGIGYSDVDLLRRAYTAMEQQLAAAWAEKGSRAVVKTPYEALILASIVEKETGLASERPEIAGVFTRRINKGMRLETDPTVIYGMGDRFDGNIRRKDLREATPYNTYVIKGLPPTPIAMPGLEAIKAVLHPAKGKSLFFVSRGDGSHYFSATYAEHKRAVRKYQLGGR